MKESEIKIRRKANWEDAKIVMEITNPAFHVIRDYLFLQEGGKDE